MAARLIDAVFAPVYLRLLGRSDVGAYTFLVVFTTYLDTLVDFGLHFFWAGRTGWIGGGRARRPCATGWRWRS